MSSTRDRRRPAPRLLNAKQAAQYCGVSAATFAAWCPVPPIRPRPGDTRKLWDIKALDAWLDGLSRLESSELHDATDPYTLWRNGRRRDPETSP